MLHRPGFGAGTGADRGCWVQMPAVNTPQFSWVRSKLPRRPQPVAPIYQPEVAARGVLRAADRPSRREYLAKTGYDAQQTSEREPTDQPDNLRQPLDQAPGTDNGAHGEI